MRVTRPDVEVAEPDREQPDHGSRHRRNDPSHDHREENRNVPYHDELGGRQGADAGEDDLGKPQHPPFAGHDREREERDRVANARRDHRQPEFRAAHDERQDHDSDER